MKRPALYVLWAALAVESAYILRAGLVTHAGWSHLTQPIVFVVLFAALALTRGDNRWITTLLRLVLAAEFGLAVADRLGWMGPPGGNVSWGDFAHFVAYTRRVNAFLPSSFAYPLAVLATIGESAFAVALALGLWLRSSAAGAAILLALFGTAMTLSGLSHGQFSYAVFVLASGAWVLAVSPPSWLSVDHFLGTRTSKTRKAAAEP